MRKANWNRIAALLAAVFAVVAPLLLHGDYITQDTELEPASEQTPPLVQIDSADKPGDDDELTKPLPESDPYAPFIAAFTPANLPGYAGIPYIEVNGSVPLFCMADTILEPFEQYSELDELGRCGAAFANIGQELMPTEPRGQIGMVRPSGWHTTRYDDLIDDHYLYNRCHLIAYQLTGENANPQNLITGTRYLNVEGMQPFENRVAAYITRTGNHVLYRVTPIFEGDDLVASGVLMEAYSIEDGGAGVCFNVYVYNVQPGVIIDYATGDSERGETPMPQGAAEVSGYIGNVRSLVYHLPSCPNLPKRQNWIIFITEDEAIEQGYSPCGNCIGKQAAVVNNAA